MTVLTSAALRNRQFFYAGYIGKEMLRAAFPSAPVAILQLLRHGDLSAALPDWMDRLDAAFEATPSALRVSVRLTAAWNAVLTAYDEAVK